MGTPTIGGTLTGSVTEGSGAIVTGNLDDVGLFTGNDDDTWTIRTGPSYGSATINATTGVWSYDLNDSHPVVKALDPGDTLTDTFRVRMLDADGRFDEKLVTITIHGAFCFAEGTLIDTPDGPSPVERLTPGQMIDTLDHGAQPLRWIGHMRFSAAALAHNDTLRPVRIEAGALGPGCPQRPLRVSRQHRMLVTGQSRRVFGADEVLIPAIQLADLPGIALDRTAGALSYYHLLFDRHEVLRANGAPCESFLLGPQALRTLSPVAHAEIAALFPEILDPAFQAQPARALGRDGQQIRNWRRALSRTAEAPLEALPA